MKPRSLPGARARRRRTLAAPSQVLAGLDIRTIGRINALPREERRRVYHSLVPLDVLLRFGINPEALDRPVGSPLLQLVGGPSSVELYLRHEPDAQDPLLYLQLADTTTNQIEVVLFMVNDPSAERFDTDRLPDGTPTHYGTQGRNVAEEIKAMKAGLAPGQVRRGLRLTRDLIPILEAFVDALHHDAFYVQPLAYHNAILFERLGFAYAMGLGRMEWIHSEFAPGGLLCRRLDGSSPFRMPGAEESVRGRSWAIHDGIMDVPYTGIKMYKRVGIHAGVITFPRAAW
jgi:hypothetical protein